MYKVGFISKSPAGANSFLPIIKKLKHESRVSIHLFAFHKCCSDAWNSECYMSEEEYPNEMKEMNLLIYSTGSGNETETAVAAFGKIHNITTVSVLDVFWSEDEGILDRYPLWPNYLIVPDKRTAIQIKSLAPHSCEILPLGNPHFDRLEPYVRNKIIHLPMKVAFFSQCSTPEPYSETKQEVKEAVKELLLISKHPHIKDIVILPHPREDISWLREHAGEFLKTDLDSTEVLYNSDLVLGVNCTLQYEGLIINKNVIQYLNQWDIVVGIHLLRFMEDKNIDIQFNATEKILDFIKQRANNYFK